MESYQQITARHQADVNAFPLGFAFSNQQFEEMMQKFGLPNDKTGYAQIVSLGAGGYMKKTDIPAWEALMKRHREEMKEFRKNRKELKEAFRYEFRNHEAQFCRDDETICRCVGLSWDEVQNDAELLKIYNDAWKLFWADCQKNDWF